MNRRSHRYVLVEFFAKTPLFSKVAEQAVHRSIEEMLGKLGSAEMRARMISFDETRCRAVFRCDSRSIEKLRAVLALMTNVDGNPVAVMVLRSSGTIRGLKIQALPH
jgi:ribonuclease P/MRP protein subunit POP5